MQPVPSFPWCIERAQILHRACQGLNRRLASGEKPGLAFRVVSHSYNGHAYKCDPKRRVKLAESTLRNLYKKWKRGGEVASVFRLHYQTPQSVLTAPILIRFLKFFCEHPQRSRRQAWRNFARLGGNFGPGRRSGKPLRISYGQLHHNFPASYFQQIRVQQDALESARSNIAVLTQKFIAEIRVRFPDRPPRRLKRELEWQI